MRSRERGEFFVTFLFFATQKTSFDFFLHACIFSVMYVVISVALGRFWRQTERDRERASRERERNGWEKRFTKKKK